MPNGAVCAIAANYEGRLETGWLALVVHCYAYTVVLLIGRNKGRFVLDCSALTTQLFHQEPLSHVLRNHGNEWIRTFFWCERHLGKSASMCHHSDGRDTIRLFKERADNAGHVEDLERPRKDRERFGMFRLRRARLDKPIS